MGVVRKVIAGLAALLFAAAVFKEWAQPRGLRVGEGHIIGVPYSFRLIGPRDLRERYWNAGGNPLAPPLFGVGVVPNLPALLRKIGL